jgi:hypothetical protein
MSGAKNNDEKRPLTRLDISKTKIDEDPNSLDSVIR